MKSVTLSSEEDKRIVRNAVPTSKIFTAGVARLHVASPDPSKWTYSQVWGAAIFCRDRSKNDSFFIRLVDLENDAGVIWEQELYEGFNYIKDATYFHTFETDDCLTALEFVDEGEADIFFKKVQSRNSLASKTSTVSDRTATGFLGHRKGNSMSKRKNKIDKNHIGMPAGFRHVGHIGYTAEKGFSVQNNEDPEWNGLFNQLKELGISADEIQNNQEFIQEFLQQNGAEPPQQPKKNAPLPPPPPSSSARQVTPLPALNPYNNRKKAPPPPPPPGRHHAPPPPPPPRRPNQSATPVPPPPPPLSSRNMGPSVSSRGGRPVPSTPMNASPLPPSIRPMGGAPPPTPLGPPGLPMMGSGVAPPPPPPPPPSGPSMMGNGASPPPPPFPPSGPPMMNSGSSAAPPPPPPPTSSGVPPSSGGRNDLMASIRAAGGFGTLKTSGKLRETETLSTTTTTPPHASAAATGAAAGGAATAGGTLASSLADVLKQRKQAMQSDDEDEDDDEWD